jgi:hypothetical protein
LHRVVGRHGLWLALGISVTSCANLWGFDDLTLGADASRPAPEAGAGAETGLSGDDGPAGDATGVEDATLDAMTVDDDADLGADGSGEGGPDVDASGTKDAGTKDATADGAPPITCNKSTCSGCCDVNGKCQLGTSTAVCGANGAACAACTCTGGITSPCCSAGACSCVTLGLGCH